MEEEDFVTGEDVLVASDEEVIFKCLNHFYMATIDILSQVILIANFFTGSATPGYR